MRGKTVPSSVPTSRMQILILVSNSGVIHGCSLMFQAGQAWGAAKESITALKLKVTVTPKRGDPCPHCWRPPLNQRQGQN